MQAQIGAAHAELSAQGDVYASAAAQLAALEREVRMQSADAEVG